jgi:ABC-type Fe3+/spermidine/putrescine transport system ATPase subunit
MFDGRIHQVGGARDIYDHPATRQVAGFIGVSNFLEGRLAGHDGALWRLETGFGAISCGAGFAPEAGGKATAMVRPEAVALAPAGAGEGFEGRVAERFFLGNLVDLRVAMADGTMLQVQQPANSGFEPGQSVRVSLPVERTWLVREDAA